MGKELYVANNKVNSTIIQDPNIFLAILSEWKELYLRVFMIMNVIDLIGYKEFTNMFKICLHLSWEKGKFDALYFLSDM